MCYVGRFRPNQKNEMLLAEQFSKWCSYVFLLGSRIICRKWLPDIMEFCITQGGNHLLMEIR